MNVDKSSFTAASTLPKKLITNIDLIAQAKLHQIRPIHVQLNPTNACPLHCSFCSCEHRDRTATMPFTTTKELLAKFWKLGTRAVTLTGGGEPLMYPEINDLIEYIADCDMGVGLVTNGVLADRLDRTACEKLTWCRISASDEQTINTKRLERLIDLPVDWSFSYVLTGTSDIANLVRCIEFANAHRFTHVRIVDDILHTGALSVHPTEQVRAELARIGIDDHLVIYQGRKEYAHGHKRCLISLLKPNIDPQGRMLPCCGVQYATDVPSLTFDERFMMNRDRTIDDVYKEQSFFDGSVCSRCYYADCNEILGMLWDAETLVHQDFI